MYEKGTINVTLKMLENLLIDTYIPTMVISKQSGYSKSAIEKAASRLVKDGYVKAKVGPTGGYRLTKPLNEIKIKEIAHYVGEQHELISRALHLLGDISVADFIGHDIK